jgi:[ribosomal protein S5]-alanine N-acetyltransferase
MLLPEVETPSLLIREVRHSDWQAFAGYMSDPQYRRWLDLPRSRFADERGPKYLVASARADQSNPRRRSYLLTAARKDSNEPVGDGFILMSRYRVAEVGWGVAPPMWGRGYGTELARLLVGMAVERLSAKSVTCKVMAPNLASRRVAEKVGFLSDGAAAAFTTSDGREVTVHLFKMTRDLYFEAPY